MGVLIKVCSLPSPFGLSCTGGQAAELPVRLNQLNITCSNNKNPISLPLGLFLLMPNLNDLTFLAAGKFIIKYRSRADFQMEITAREQQMALFAGLEKLHLLLEEMLIGA